MDLDKHVDVYTTQMSLYTSNNRCCAECFPLHLKGGCLVGLQGFFPTWWIALKHYCLNLTPNSQPTDHTT